MARHNVTCVKCGLVFDASEPGFSYDEFSRRYTCPECTERNRIAAIEYAAKRKIWEKEAAAEREKQEARRRRQDREAAIEKKKQSAKMKQSIGAMIAKIAVGCLFLVVSFGMDNAGEVCVGLILAAALIAWGFVPYFMAKKKQEELRRKEARRKKVCPACGATTRGDTCEYCGSDLSGAE